MKSFIKKADKFILVLLLFYIVMTIYYIILGGYYAAILNLIFGYLFYLLEKKDILIKELKNKLEKYQKSL